MHGKADKSREKKTSVNDPERCFSHYSHILHFLNMKSSYNGFVAGVSLVGLK